CERADGGEGVLPHEGIVPLTTCCRSSGPLAHLRRLWRCSDRRLLSEAFELGPETLRLISGLCCILASLYKPRISSHGAMHSCVLRRNHAIRSSGLSCARLSGYSRPLSSYQLVQWGSEQRWRCSGRPN